jgi:predicted dehydrogenase
VSEEAGIFHDGGKIIVQALRVGLIGCGAISQAHLQWLAAIPEAQVVALVDPRAEAIEYARQHWLSPEDRDDVHTYANHRSMLAAGDIDAALVLTPHAYHADPIRDCLDAGLHVLSEKPLATDSRLARELIDHAQQCKRILMTAFQFPLLAPYRYAREVVTSGELGPLQYVSASLSMDWIGIDTPWRRDARIAGGGALLDSGSHLIDLLLHLTNSQPLEVTALTDTRDTSVDIISTLSIRFAEGCIGNVTMIGHGPWEWSIKLIGSRGALIFRDVEDLLYLDAADYARPAKQQRKRSRKPHIDQLPPTLSPDDVFVHAALANDRSASNGERALAVLHVIEAAYTSARTGRPAGCARSLT